ATTTRPVRSAAETVPTSRGSTSNARRPRRAPTMIASLIPRRPGCEDAEQRESGYRGEPVAVQDRLAPDSGEPASGGMITEGNGEIADTAPPSDQARAA